jgi:hypothetical protein
MEFKRIIAVIPTRPYRNRIKTEAIYLLNKTPEDIKESKRIRAITYFRYL